MPPTTYDVNMPMRDSDVKWMHKQGNKMDVDDKLVDPSKLPKTPEEMLDLVVELLKKNPRIADEIAKGVAMGTAAPSELPPPHSPGPQGPPTPGPQGQAAPGPQGQAAPGPQGQAAPGPQGHTPAASPQGGPVPVQLSPTQRNSLATGLGRAQSSLQGMSVKSKPTGQSGGAPGNANKPPPITISSPAGATPGKAPQTSPQLSPFPQTGPNASNAKPPQTGPPNAPGPQGPPNAPGPQGPPLLTPNASSTEADTKVVRFGDTAIFGTASISGLFAAADPADPSKKPLLNADNFAAYLQYLLGRAVQCLGQQFEEGDAAGCGKQLGETIASDLRTDAGHSLVQSAINLAAANNNTPEEQRLVTFVLDDAAAPTTLSATIGGKPGEFSLDLGAYKDEYAPVIMMDFVMYAFCRANQVVASNSAAPPPSTAITQDALKEALRSFEKGKSAGGGGKKKSKRARRVEPILAIFQMAKSAPLPRRKRIRIRKALAKKPIAKKTSPKKKNNKTLKAKTAVSAKKKPATVARRAK